MPIQAIHRQFAPTVETETELNYLKDDRMLTRSLKEQKNQIS